MPPIGQDIPYSNGRTIQRLILKAYKMGKTLDLMPLSMLPSFL